MSSRNLLDSLIFEPGGGPPRFSNTAATTSNAQAPTAESILRAIDRIAERFPPIGTPYFDPFGLSLRPRLYGLDVRESPDRPRYEVPEWIIPPGPLLPEGLRVNPKTRQEVNRWALRVCGTTNPVPPGRFFVMAGQYVVARREDIVKLTSL